jgi:hypothetical protein
MKRRERLGRFVHGKSHIDTLGNVSLGILELGFRQSRPGRRRPVNWLATPKDVPLLEHFSKHSDLRRLKLGLQGQVGMFKISKNTKALERCRLLINRFLGKGSSLFPQRNGS